MINLFEYQNKEPYPDSLDGLEVFLDDIWNSREKSAFYSDIDDQKIESQRFIQFLHQSKTLKSNKYVGVIHYGDHKINLLPKIFFDAHQDYNAVHISQIQNHVLWWLSYCRKIKFPSYQSALGQSKSDFFEVLIYLFSKYTRELLNSSIYQQYEEVNRELSYIKGRLNITDYITKNLSQGRWHKLNCTYDAFAFDNEFNRIVKYVAQLLFNATSSQENKKNLREILFVLDEVSDIRATPEQCDNIVFNPMFGAFETVRDFCKLFLNHCVSFDYKNDLKLFAFLLPMEYVFEDFIYGFIEQELASVTAKAQRSDTYLDESKNFKLKPDLYIETACRAYIADTKYKIVYSDAKDPKKGISQTDLYQMLSYAVRFEVDEVLLFYPNTLTSAQANSTEMILKDMLANQREITIKAFQLPILDPNVFHSALNTELDLAELFEPTRKLLKQRLQGVFTSEVSSPLYNGVP